MSDSRQVPTYTLDPEPELREIATGLIFPEGPIALPDGSFVLVEMVGNTLTRITADGRREVIANIHTGPNGAAIGPDGRCYVCVNGGIGQKLPPDAGKPNKAPTMAQVGWPPIESDGGSIRVVDLKTGRTEVLYEECNGWPLTAPNDLVFDGNGGFYFTDLGKQSQRVWVRGRVYYARADGSSIQEVIVPLDAANGIGLSRDEKTLYVAQTAFARLWAFDITAPGVVHTERAPTMGGRLLAALPRMGGFDSLALDADGNICVGTLHPGAITVIAPDGSSIREIPMPDASATNICFGGPDLRTAYITLSRSGRLVAMPWPVPGQPLNCLNK
ncbi:MAG: SMP-30/gluconolactonase/LRE family protein [Gammaproteobacteria bacterium]